jgi:hypothetical protein
MSSNSFWEKNLPFMNKKIKAANRLKKVKIRVSAIAKT